MEQYLSKVLFLIGCLALISGQAFSFQTGGRNTEKPFAECLDENGYAPYKKKAPAYVNDGPPWPYTPVGQLPFLLTLVSN